MIIECEKCHTKFRLDESLLKETGSKVRCSICTYKFILFPPKAEPQIKVELPGHRRREGLSGGDHREYRTAAKNTVRLSAISAIASGCWEGLVMTSTTPCMK